MTAPNPLTLTWVTNPADATPDFDIALPMGTGTETDAAAGDVLVVQYSVSGSGSWSTYFTDTLSDVDVTRSGITETAPTLLSGDYLFRGRLERGAEVAAWSAEVVVTISTAPVVHFRIRRA